MPFRFSTKHFDDLERRDSLDIEWSRTKIKLNVQTITETERELNEART